MKLIQKADVIIFAGSLVNPEILDYARRDAKIFNSAKMHLEEVLSVIKKAASEGKLVVRLHTGDPSIYGAIQEQMDALKEMDISFEVIPGVSSFLAAAASLQQEYTLPGVTQTVVLTRMEGRTPVPDKEKLYQLAAHGATMCIFLSVHDISNVVEQLRHGYSEDTPVVVIQKASWPDQKIIRGSLADIAKKVEEANISKTALIIVSNVFKGDYEKSKLYDPAFTHGFREGIK